MIDTCCLPDPVALDNILPDSRLLNRDMGVVVTDWPLVDGTTIKMQLNPIFCFNCGKPNGYVPNDVVSFVSWLCQKCSETHGELAANWMTSDQEFWAKVGAEMIDRFGRILTQEELERAVVDDRLGSYLKLLERESPYVV